MQGKDISCFDKCRNNILVKLINSRRNMHMLKEVPHVELYDLSMVFLIQLNELNSKEDVQKEFLLIKNEMFVQWDIRLEELLNVGKENIKRQNAIYMKNIGYMNEDMKGNPNLQESLNNNLSMFLLTNNDYTFGAIFMAYPDILAEVAERIGDSYYILPVSVHILILLPKNSVHNTEKIKKIVAEINSEIVPKEDYLSDNIYYYDKKVEEITIL